MLSKVQKRKKIDSHDLQSLRNVVKKEEETVIKDFKDKFQEVIVEGKTYFVNYTKLSSGNKDLHSKNTNEELQALYMVTSSEAWKRF